MPLRKYRPVVKINSVEVPISGFSFNAPAGSLGCVADVTIADNALSFERGDTFDLILHHESLGDPKTNLIKGGRVVGDSRSIGIGRNGGTLAPNDTYSLKAVDLIAEKHKLSPRIPAILYDPSFTVLEDNSTDTGVNDEDGDPIVATTQAENDLDLYTVLEFAYVEKCEFSEYITNIPTYNLPRADFALNTSFHSVATAFVNYFKPVVYEDDERLFIIDIFGELPAGIIAGARNVNTDKYTLFSKANPDRAIVNAVLLSHKQVSAQSLNEDEFPANVTQRIEDDPPNDIGTPGALGWQRTLLRRYIAEIHDDIDDPAKITSEITWKTETRISGRDENGITRELEINTKTDKYSNSWRLMIGWERRATIYAGDGSGGKALQEAETEIGVIEYKALNRFPGEYEKVRMMSQLTGLVLVEGESPDETLTPLRDANNANSIPDDDSASIELRPIQTTSQVWRDSGPDQIQVLSNKLNQLTNTPESSGTTEHVGTNRVRVRSGESVNTRQVLLVDAASDTADGAREPISYDAGYLPYEIAKELALRALDHAKNPRMTVSCTLASFDAGIHRGSIRKIYDRAGNFVTAIITGYSVKGTAGQRGMLEISQSIEGVVIAA